MHDISLMQVITFFNSSEKNVKKEKLNLFLPYSLREIRITYIEQEFKEKIYFIF